MQHFPARSTQTGNVPAAVAGLAVVNIWYGGQSIGLYHVKHIDTRALVLNPGSISFAAGTQLEVVDFQYLIPDTVTRRLYATVRESGCSGIQLVW